MISEKVLEDMIFDALNGDSPIGFFLERGLDIRPRRTIAEDTKIEVYRQVNCLIFGRLDVLVVFNSPGDTVYATVIELKIEDLKGADVGQVIRYSEFVRHRLKQESKSKKVVVRSILIGSHAVSIGSTSSADAYLLSKQIPDLKICEFTINASGLSFMWYSNVMKQLCDDPEFADRNKEIYKKNKDDMVAIARMSHEKEVV